MFDGHDFDLAGAKDYVKKTLGLGAVRRFDRNVADSVVFVDHGRAVESGTPDQLFDDPQTDRLKQFLSQVL